MSGRILLKKRPKLSHLYRENFDTPSSSYIHLIFIVDINDPKKLEYVDYLKILIENLLKFCRSVSYCVKFYDNSREKSSHFVSSWTVRCMSKITRSRAHYGLE